MRRTTIDRRLRLSLLPKEAIDELHVRMRGLSDASTEVGRENNLCWTLALRTTGERFPAQKRSIETSSWFSRLQREAPKGIASAMLEIARRSDIMKDVVVSLNADVNQTTSYVEDAADRIFAKLGAG